MKKYRVFSASPTARYTDYEYHYYNNYVEADSPEEAILKTVNTSPDRSSLQYREFTVGHFGKAFNGEKIIGISGPYKVEEVSNLQVTKVESNV